MGCESYRYYLPCSLTVEAPFVHTRSTGGGRYPQLYPLEDDRPATKID